MSTKIVAATALVTTLFVISVAKTAAVVVPVPQAQPSMFAGYAEFCGIPVVVTPNPNLGTASRDRFGNPVIHIDPSVMANWSISRVFTIAHECGHHMLGHTTPQGIWWRNTQFWATRSQELEADCWAASVLAGRGYYRGDLERAVIEFAMRGAAMERTYPSGQERAQQVARCATGF